MIPTLTGPLDARQLGRTLMHEHVVVLDHELMRTFPHAYAIDREAVITAAATRLDALAADGIDSIVDMTVLGLGRDISLMVEVAARTRMQIVPATGAYVLRDLPPTLQLRGPGRTAFGGPEPLVELFLHDLREGIEGSGIKAGVLKCAVDRFGMTKDCERVTRAVGQAHRETGALISTHSNASHRTGLEQHRVLAEEGVPLDRVLIGHCGDTADLDYLRQLMDAGSAIGLDRFGLDFYLPHERRLDVLVTLAGQGYADRMVLSHDASCHHVGYSHDEMAAIAPRHDLSLIPSQVVPALLERGVDEKAIEAMLVDNPRRLLTPG